MEKESKITEAKEAKEKQESRQFSEETKISEPIKGEEASKTIYQVSGEAKLDSKKVQLDTAEKIAKIEQEANVAGRPKTTEPNKNEKGSETKPQISGELKVEPKNVQVDTEEKITKIEQEAAPQQTPEPNKKEKGPDKSQIREVKPIQIDEKVTKIDGTKETQKEGKAEETEPFTPLKKSATTEKESSERAYQVTTPTSTRRVQSQRFSREERPNLVPVHFTDADTYSSDEDAYTVDEPKDERDERARISSSPDIFGNDMVDSTTTVQAMPEPIAEQVEDVKEILQKDIPNLREVEVTTIDSTVSAEIGKLISAERTPTVTKESGDKSKLESLTHDNVVTKKLDSVVVTETRDTTTDATVSETKQVVSEEIFAKMDLKTSQTKKVIQETETQVSAERKISNAKDDTVNKISKTEETAKVSRPISLEIDSKLLPKIDDPPRSEVEIKSGTGSTPALERSQEPAQEKTRSNTQEATCCEEAFQTTQALGRSQEPTEKSFDEEPFDKPLEIPSEKEPLKSETRETEKEVTEAKMGTKQQEKIEVTQTDVAATTPEKLEERGADVLEPLPSLPQSPEKPRALFHIESDDDPTTDIDPEDRPRLGSQSSVDSVEKIKTELESVLELEAGRVGIFEDLTTDSLIKTKELVDERLRKISDTKPPEVEEKVEEPPPVQIGRFQVQAAPDPVVVEEKLTEADVEEVIRELESEGLQPGVYLEQEKEKDKKLKRVERRFERMASETLEGEKVEVHEAAESVEAKREMDFERLVSQLSTEEVTECQGSALWDEGGVSSFTPTEDWESRDPDTPHNELDDDSPRRPDLQGFQGSDRKGLEIPPKPVPDPVPQSQPDETTETQSYGDRKKFWETMSSTETKSFTESMESVKTVSQETGVVLRGKKVEEIKQEIRKSLDETGLVKSLTESYSEKIAAGELVMPAVPRPISMPPKLEHFETEALPQQSSTDRAVLSELEARLQGKQSDELATDTVAQEFTAQEISQVKQVSGAKKSSFEAENVEFTIGGKTIRSTEEEISQVEQVSGAEKSSFETENVEYTITTIRSTETGISHAEQVTNTEKSSFEAENVKFTIDSTDEEITDKKIHGKSAPPREESVDSETDFIARYGEEVVAFENSGFQEEEDDIVTEDAFGKRPPPVIPVRKSIYERSMSLPTADLAESAHKVQKREFEAQMKKEIIVEQLMAHVEEECSPPEHKSIAEIIRQDSKVKQDVSPDKEVAKKTITEITRQDSKAKQDLSPEEIFEKEVKEVAKQTITELICASEDIADIRRKSFEKLDLELKNTTSTAISSTAQEALQFKRTESVSRASDSLEVHVDKSELESSEKQKDIDEVLKSIEVTVTAPRGLETASVGESDTRSESDITPEDGRAAENDDGLWDMAIIHSDGTTPKEDKDIQLRDGQRIGRWVGQENLAQEKWTKEDSLDECQPEPKWERTRSETASPKDPVVYTPEEHYPDTVWEVPVQEQQEDEEVIQDIPIEKQTIVEKDEDEYEDEEQREMTEDEAREIATDIIDYIEEEVEKRAHLLRTGSEEETSDVEKKMDETVSTYIRQLAGEKNLDEREVELIESVLAKKQREEIMKIQRTGTGGSSLEITDEELRSSGMESSPRDSLYEPKEAERRRSETIAEEEDKEGPSAEEIVTKTIDEARESLGAIKETLIEHSTKMGRMVTESSSEFEFTSSAFQKENKVTSPQIEILRGSSEEYDDRVKSPPGPDPSSSSSGEKLTSGSKPEIVLRSSSSSRSSRKTHDRLSAIEMEHYSSSGESHYQSFEGTSSRPCSSDVEAMLGTTGSSEYESALSQSRFTTTGEYATAKSTFSSRDSSVKSLDSESSGHLGSVEISSDASETLIASALELDRDEGYGVMLLDDDSPDMDKPSRPDYLTQTSAPATANRPSIDEDFEPSEAEPSSNGEASDDEATEQAPTPPDGIEIKMKRSQEMTFQPQPEPITTASSVEASPGDVLDNKFVYGSSLEETASIISMQDDRLASSLEETGSILSISTASDISAARTIIELSRTESERIETSLTLSAASADSGSREELDSLMMSSVPALPPTSDMGTSTVTASLPTKTASVTLTTSSVDESGSICVSTQVTSISRKGSEADDASQSSTSHTEELETSSKKGHRRKESTSFVPNMLWTVGETQPGKKREIDDLQERAESDQYQIVLTDKEGKNDEKKESDESEKTEESHQTEADQAIHRDLRGQIFVAESDRTISFEEETAEFSADIQLELDNRREEYPSQASPSRDERSETQSQADFLSEKQTLDLGDKLLLQASSATTPVSPGDIPDITVTQHMKPMIDRDFHYPDLELEEQETKVQEDNAQTPASISSHGSSTASTDQGKEYVVNEESDLESKQTISTATVETIRETLREDDELSSPTDSFELLDKPDLSDEFVIIEEVGKEAQEHDMEGKSVEISTQGMKRKVVKKKSEEELLESPPAPATKMTDVKYFPGDEGPFQFESDSTSSSANSEEMDILQYERQLEESKKWIEMQFQEQAAGVEYERQPLEDIKEEELNEFDSSSKIGSMGSMKESLGSIGSKGSFSSTPDYDVLAGRKYFTRGENDDISMSSLQEFELLERKIIDGRKSGSSGSSQDSLNCRRLGTSNKSTGADDVSGSSLKDFETIENVCVTVVKIEKKAKEDEIMLSEIEEGHESQVSESESCETMSAGLMEKECDSEDFDRKMFEIDEIIKQAKTNVEGAFMDVRVVEKTESIGRGDSLEEVSKIPDLELDDPRSKLPKVTYSTQVVTKKQVQKWRAEESDLLRTSIESPDHRSGSDSLEIKNKAHSVSTDSIEQEIKRKGDIMTDSIEQGDTISIDSFDVRLEKKGQDTMSVDSMERAGRPISEIVSDSLEALHRSDSPDFGEDEIGAIGDLRRPPPRSDYVLGSSDSLGLDPSSSNATHATYQYETDSVMSSSFTSGGSNTLVSDGEPQDEEMGATARAEAWFENITTGGQPFVTETVEHLGEGEFSHTIHRTVEMAPSVRKVVFTGSGAEDALKDYIEGFEPGEEVTETEEIDEHGNVHIKRVVQRRILVRPDELDQKNMTKDELQTYFKQFETTTYGSQYPESKIPTKISTTQAPTGPKGDDSGTDEADVKQSHSGTAARRRQLIADISMDDDAEYDTTEHDCRQMLQQLHAEADETEIDLQLDAALASHSSVSKS